MHGKLSIFPHFVPSNRHKSHSSEITKLLVLHPCHRAINRHCLLGSPRPACQVTDRDDPERLGQNGSSSGGAGSGTEAGSLTDGSCAPCDGRSLTGAAALMGHGRAGRGYHRCWHLALSGQHLSYRSCSTSDGAVWTRQTLVVFICNSKK